MDCTGRGTRVWVTRDIDNQGVELKSDLISAKPKL